MRPLAKFIAVSLVATLAASVGHTEDFGVSRGEVAEAGRLDSQSVQTSSPEFRAETNFYGQAPDMMFFQQHHRGGSTQLLGIFSGGPTTARSAGLKSRRAPLNVYQGQSGWENTQSALIGRNAVDAGHQQNGPTPSTITQIQTGTRNSQTLHIGVAR